MRKDTVAFYKDLYSNGRIKIEGKESTLNGKLEHETKSVVLMVIANQYYSKYYFVGESTSDNYWPIGGEDIANYIMEHHPEAEGEWWHHYGTAAEEVKSVLDVDVDEDDEDDWESYGEEDEEITSEKERLSRDDFDEKFSEYFIEISDYATDVYVDVEGFEVHELQPHEWLQIIGKESLTETNKGEKNMNGIIVKQFFEDINQKKFIKESMEDEIDTFYDDEDDFDDDGYWDDDQTDWDDDDWDLHEAEIAEEIDPHGI